MSQVPSWDTAIFWPVVITFGAGCQTFLPLLASQAPRPTSPPLPANNHSPSADQLTPTGYRANPLKVFTHSLVVKSPTKTRASPVKPTAIREESGAIASPQIRGASRWSGLTGGTPSSSGFVNARLVS